MLRENLPQTRNYELENIKSAKTTLLQSLIFREIPNLIQLSVIQICRAKIIVQYSHKVCKNQKEIYKRRKNK